MFPSGNWRGFWEAPGWGKGWMQPLMLSFHEGIVEGHGIDCIGLFTFNGTYSEDGQVTLAKHYLGKHSVHYEGRAEGEGAVIGQWFIPPAWSGPFALMPIIEDVGELPIATITADPPQT